MEGHNSQVLDFCDKQMKIELNEDKELVATIRAALKEKNGYCPCVVGCSEETKCICHDFKHNVAVGDYCHCGLYKKIEQ